MGKIERPLLAHCFFRFLPRDLVQEPDFRQAPVSFHRFGRNFEQHPPFDSHSRNTERPRINVCRETITRLEYQFRQ